MHFSSSSYCLNKIKVYTVCILGCNILLLKGPTNEEAALPCRESYICQEIVLRSWQDVLSFFFLYNLQHICITLSVCTSPSSPIEDMLYKQVLCFFPQIKTNSSHLICSICLDIEISIQVDIHVLYMCVCRGGTLYFFLTMAWRSPVCSRY